MNDTAVTPYVPTLFDELTPREQAFVQHPEVMINANKAAVDAGYSESYAKSFGYKLRRQLMYYIRPIAEARLAAIGVSPERVRDEMAAIAFANPADFYEVVDDHRGGAAQVVAKNPLRLPDHLQRAIKQLHFETIVLPDATTISVLTSIELHDKQKSLKELAEILGLKQQKAGDGDVGAAEQSALLQHLSPKELEAVVKLHKTAADRARAALSAKRDADAIPGEVVSVQK